MVVGIPVAPSGSSGVWDPYGSRDPSGSGVWDPYGG